MLPAIDQTKLPPNCRVVVIPEDPPQPSHSLFADLPEICETQEAANALRISTKHLRDMAAQGQISAFRSGRKWLFTREALIEYVRGGGHG